jgi:hypothetical protein
MADAPHGLKKDIGPGPRTVRSVAVTRSQCRRCHHPNLPITLGIFGSGCATVSVTVSPTSTLEPGNGAVNTTVPFGCWFVSFVWTLTSKPAASSSAVASSMGARQRLARAPSPRARERVAAEHS